MVRVFTNQNKFFKDDFKLIFKYMNLAACEISPKYLKKQNFNFSERQESSIMSQISNGVKYLHKYA
jgi:serine/threonine protein kinase